MRTQKIFACPFFTTGAPGMVQCEIARITFWSHKEYSDFTDRFCCDVINWERCSLAEEHLKEYERRDTHEGRTEED